MARSIMIQGTGSNVGKSVLVAGLCRAFTRRGMRVRPFKPQNMSNNSAVTADGGEVGRAQALQARACRTGATIDMNPVLLKPESESGSQIVVRGKRFKSVRAGQYNSLKLELVGTVIQSFENLCSEADLVIAEGAGSPAETNLRRGDIANMGFARSSGVPVILVGDIDRGGVIAQMVGTKAVLDQGDASMVQGFVINKFRGDIGLFKDGYETIKRMTGWQGLGILPWFDQATALPAEDTLAMTEGERSDSAIKVACLSLPRISNFDDLDPLRLDPQISLKMLKPQDALPAEVDLVIIPGSKSTRNDLDFIRKQGWDVDIHAHVRRGGSVLGICGGYQMLGRSIDDPDGVDGPPGTSDGLGLLRVDTTMLPEKTVVKTRVRCNGSEDNDFEAYEIHMGRTDGPDRRRSFATVVRDGSLQNDGAVSPDGRVVGTYLHGLLSSDRFRSRFLASLGFSATSMNYESKIDNILDSLADHLETHLDLQTMFKLTAKIEI